MLARATGEVRLLECDGQPRPAARAAGGDVNVPRWFGITAVGACL